MEHQFLCKIIPRNRFQGILRVLEYDDDAARQSGRSPDKFSSIKNALEVWNESLLDAFVPSANLTVNKQLETFCGRCPFRQYMPSKPRKYGIKISAI